jgi:hypothetical protein
MDDNIIELFGSNKRHKKVKPAPKPLPVDLNDEEDDEDDPYERPLVVMDREPDYTDPEYSLQWWEAHYPNTGEIGWEIAHLQNNVWMSSVVSTKPRLKVNHLALPILDWDNKAVGTASFAFYAAVLLHDAKLTANKVDEETYMSFVLTVGDYNMTLTDVDRIYHISNLLPQCFDNDGMGALTIQPGQFDDHDNDEDGW